MPLRTDFAALEIEYDDRVLTPRAWTVLQSRWAAELALDAGPDPILELCCGAGHIGLEAVRSSAQSLVCVDLNPVAVEFTRRNAARAGLAERVETRLARVEEALAPGEFFSVAIADPPWVLSDQIGAFPADPPVAIDGGPDGLDVARACVGACLGHLRCGGSLLLQLGTLDQADALAADAARDGWLDRGRRQGERGVILRLIHP